MHLGTFSAVVRVRPAIDGVNFFPATMDCRREMCMIPRSTQVVLTGIPPAKQLVSPGGGGGQGKLSPPGED